jgi:hypothetical protein
MPMEWMNESDIVGSLKWRNISLAENVEGKGRWNVWKCLFGMSAEPEFILICTCMCIWKVDMFIWEVDMKLLCTGILEVDKNVYMGIWYVRVYGKLICVCIWEVDTAAHHE